MYRRLPKQGFICLKSRFHQEVRLSSLAIFDEQQVITLDILKDAGIVKSFKRTVKIFMDRPIEGKRQIQGLPASSGAQAYLTEVVSAD
jgi:large subunit ribosomal protein L15